VASRYVQCQCSIEQFLLTCYGIVNSPEIRLEQIIEAMNFTVVQPVNVLRTSCLLNSHFFQRRLHVKVEQRIRDSFHVAFVRKGANSVQCLACYHSFIRDVAIREKIRTGNAFRHSKPVNDSFEVVESLTGKSFMLNERVGCMQG
jgi:hypothetical protein